MMEQTDSVPAPLGGTCFGGAGTTTVNNYSAEDGNSAPRQRILPYRRYEDRLRSFADWPKFLNPRPEALARAGFYYIGRGDKVKCFKCGVMLHNWEPNDDPVEEHRRWSHMCQYLRIIYFRKEEEYLCIVCGRPNEWGHQCFF